MMRLQTMLQKQYDFQSRMGNEISEMSNAERTAYIKEHSIHATQELHEMLYELPFFKPWKDYSNMTLDEQEEDMQKAREEFIDMWHFMLNMALALDMDESIIYAMYMDKHQENIDRQDRGYTHKDRLTGRDTDDTNK